MWKEPNRNMVKNSEYPDLGEALSLSRLQNEIRDGKAKINGRMFTEFEEMMTEVNIRLGELISTEEGERNFIRIRDLSDQLEISELDLEEGFSSGLRYNFKAACRLGFFDDGDRGEMIDRIIGAYSFNFLRVLNDFNKGGFDDKYPSRFVLDVARKAYLLKPRIYRTLLSEYEGDDFVDKWMIRRFIVDNPIDPRGAIENARALYQEIKDEIGDEEGDVICGDATLKHIVVCNNGGSRGKIQKVREDCIELGAIYDGDEFVRPWMIKYFAINTPKNLREAIENARRIFKS